MITEYWRFMQILNEAEEDLTGEGDELDPEEFDDFDDEEDEATEEESADDEEEEKEEEEKRRPAPKEGEEPVYVNHNKTLLNDNFREYSRTLKDQFESQSNDFVLDDIKFDVNMPGASYISIKTYLDDYYGSIEIMAPIGSVVSDPEKPNKITDVFLTITVYDGNHDLVGKMIENRIKLSKVDADFLQKSFREVVEKTEDEDE